MSINRLKYYITNETNPYMNLAVEEYLLHNVTNDECIMYLWQNEKTVVIGRNQNPWKECRIKELNEAGGRLVRRLSGGGAVYHDMGNLNFTFLLTKDNYNVDKQLEIIIKAINDLGIHAVKSGRNDIAVEGRKFSGNAFYSVGNQCYHHGTVLVDADISSLSKYLNVSKTKLKSKGVSSVVSRVANLMEFRQDITVEMLKDRLITAFGEAYNLEPTKMDMALLPHEKIKHISEKFSSWDWNYGRKIEFSDSFEGRFDWGDIELQLIVEGGIIKDCRAYSDSLDTELFGELPKYLKRSIFTAEAMEEALRNIKTKNYKKQIIEDIVSLIHEGF